MFIQVIQGHCADQQRLRDLTERWERELASGAAGWLGATYGFADDGTFVGVVRFDSAESAVANSERPEQHTWWAEAESCFDGPVEFHDCPDVTTLMTGGSDQAGFVQVIRGKVDRPDRLKAFLGRDNDLLHQMRPEIIGATLGVEADGTFTETVAFTDERSARTGEQTEMPQDGREELMGYMEGASFLDLREPWFASPR